MPRSSKPCAWMRLINRSRWELHRLNRPITARLARMRFVQRAFTVMRGSSSAPLDYCKYGLVCKLHTLMAGLSLFTLLDDCNILPYTGLLWSAGVVELCLLADMPIGVTKICRRRLKRRQRHPKSPPYLRQSRLGLLRAVSLCSPQSSRRSQPCLHVRAPKLRSKMGTARATQCAPATFTMATTTTSLVARLPTTATRSALATPFVPAIRSVLAIRSVVQAVLIAAATQFAPAI